MTMHGMFWKFPRSFTPANSAGIEARSTYLKVIGDFCRWGDRIVCGCDDTAKSEFLNTRKAKGNLSAPGRSQSNLWFIEPSKLDNLGPALGRGSVWLDDPVRTGVPSDPFLFSGFERRMLHLAQEGDAPLKVTLEVDPKGNGSWKPFREIEVPARGYAWTVFAPNETGVWIRVKADRDCATVSATFHYSNRDSRGTGRGEPFSGLALPGDKSVNGGLLLVRGDRPALAFSARDEKGDLGCYELDGELKLKRVGDAGGVLDVKKSAAIPEGVLAVDQASVLYVDTKGRWRLPKNDPAFDGPGAIGPERVCREVATERDIFNAHGTFYELPAENAGGVARIRPVATHNLRIKDYASYRGLLVMSGLSSAAKAGDHVVRSDDGKCALWVGAIDDLWKFGKPRGEGGPWKDTAVKANTPSDPYLMTGYDKKSVKLSHDSGDEVELSVEVNFGGKNWSRYKSFKVPAGQVVAHEFPEGFSAYWVRIVSSLDCKATAWFVYE